MTSYSAYPSQIDGYATMPLRVDGVHEIRAVDHNRLRDAIIKIEQELGIEPSSVFATVRARLDSISDASASIESHLVDAIDAHDASAISVLDSSENFTSTDVEGALVELASVLPPGLDIIGQDRSAVSNSGIPDFVDNTGTLHLYNTSTVGTDVAKTQTIDITGFHIIEVGENNGPGTAELRMSNHSPATIEWKAPGDVSFGSSVDISALSVGEVATISSNTTTKKIRIAINSSSFPVGSPTTETFDVLRLSSATGAYSYTGTGIIDSDKITRSAISITGTSRNQFMIGGIVFPADSGTLVLQRKLRAGASEFVPIAKLDLAANFDESLRDAGQLVYTPTLSSYDSIILFDRLPARPDYETLSTDADGNSVYDNFDITSVFSPQQIAKYRIPISNSTIANATLETITDISAAEIEAKVSSYRVVHYKDGVTDFIGEPASVDIISISDALGNINDGDNNVRMSNLIIDPNTTRPSINQLVLRPELDLESVIKTVSGIHYYNGSSDLFDIELRSETDLFSNAYLNDDILRFTTDVFQFDGYGATVAVTEMIDDGYIAFGNANLPSFSDRGFYIATAGLNTGSRLYPATNKFSNKARINAGLYDPFGTSGTVDSYGLMTDGTELRMLVNSYSESRATASQEWFTDESLRIGVSEVFDFDLDPGQFAGTGVGGTLGSWNNSTLLSFGDLQCGGIFTDNQSSMPGLVIPQSDYSVVGVRPTQAAAVYDGVGYQVDSTYQRLFTLGKVTNGGKLRVRSVGDYKIEFDTIDVSNSSRPIKIEVKIPGSGGNATGFMDVGKLFQTGKIVDGDGALSGPVIGSAGDLVIPFTFGGNNNTADTGYMIAVRVTYFGATQYADAATRIISMIELLQ